MQDHIDAVALLEPADHDLDVELTGARDQQLLGLRIASDADGRVLVADLGQRRGELVLVTLGRGFEGKADGRLGDRSPGR